MKINSVAHSDAISKYVNSVNSTPAKSPVTASISDSVELSDGAQKFSALLKAAKETMEKTGANEEVRAADIVTAINEGSYKVSTDEVISGILGGVPSNC